MSKSVKSSSELRIPGTYVLEKEEWLDEVNGLGLLFRHVRSGARMFIVSNSDENKTFCAAFRTTPDNSTGVPHIIEHTVLCGSDEFPSKDPFMALAKGSLNTFLNAMTYPDKTLYPVASYNDKDFDNLMHVYLDAVFFPNIYRHKEIFMQEGWHYHIEKPEDELTLNGVVYSEMKGAMSSPDQVVYDYMFSGLYPDTTYGVNSGGDPDVIPELTYEDYLDFHRRYYHPSNSYLFLYGDVDIEEKLTWIDGHYLSKFEAIDIDSHIDVQKKFGCMKEINKTYSIPENESPEGKTYFAIASLCSEKMSAEEIIAWDIISNVLINMPGAPLKQAFIDAGIGQDFFGGLESDLMEPCFGVVSVNAKHEDRDRIVSLYFDTLRQIVKQGLNKKSILAYINDREFRLREADYGSTSRGIYMIIDSLKSWLYDDDAVFEMLHPTAVLAKVKEKIDTDYFERLIEKCLINTDHSVFLTLDAEPGLMDRKNNELRERLAAKKASLTEDELKELVASTNRLLEYQSAEPTEEELNCIPSISRGDIKREARRYNYTKTDICGFSAIRHDVFTNGISYAKLVFDIGELPADMIPYISLLGEMFRKVNTKNYTFRDINDEIRIYTGGIGLGTNIYRKFGTPDEGRFVYQIDVSAIGGNMKKAMELALEVATTSDFSDHKRIREILAESVAGKQNHIIGAGNRYGVMRAMSYINRLDCINELLGGVESYYFRKELLDSFDTVCDGISDKLAKLVGFIFNKANLTISFAGDDEGLNAFKEGLSEFVEGTDRLERPVFEGSTEIVPVQRNEAFAVSSQVNYMCRTGNLYKAGLQPCGALNVASNALDCDYLYVKIRIQGGAYGYGCHFSTDIGNAQFYSYRDPKLAETNDVYLAAADFLRNLDVDEKELTKYIIGTFSSYDRPQNAKAQIATAVNRYYMERSYESAQKERDEMLDVTLDQIRDCAKYIDAVMAQDNKCVFGNGQKIEHDKDLFKEVKTV